MYSLILQNEQGDKLTFNKVGAPFTITNIQGLNPPTATINTVASALVDGAKFNSAKANMRSINIAFAIEYSAEYHRTVVYDVLKTKKPIRLFYKSTYRDVMIDGYIESINITYFEKKQICTVAILCPAPYLKGAQEVVNELSAIINAFHFPFASTEEPELVMGYINALTNINVDNDGEIETGLTFELYAKKAISNPKIYNYKTGEYIGLDFSMEVGDLITITTERGNKTVTLLRNGVESNAFNYVMEGSTWLQLNLGENEFVYEVGTGYASNLLITIKHYDMYEGV